MRCRRVESYRRQTMTSERCEDDVRRTSAYPQFGSRHGAKWVASERAFRPRNQPKNPSNGFARPPGQFPRKTGPSKLAFPTLSLDTLVALFLASVGGPSGGPVFVFLFACFPRGLLWPLRGLFCASSGLGPIRANFERSRAHIGTRRSKFGRHRPTTVRNRPHWGLDFNQPWPEFDRSWPRFGRIWREVGQTWADFSPKSARVVAKSTEASPMSATLGKVASQSGGVFPELGPLRSIFGRIRANSRRTQAKVGRHRPPMWSSSDRFRAFGRCRPSSDRRVPIFARPRSNFARIRPFRAEIGLNSNLDPLGPMLTQVGPHCGNVCRCWPKSGQMRSKSPQSCSGIWAKVDRRIA